MNKKIILKDLTIFIKEDNILGDFIIIVDNHTKRANLISKDIGYGLMIDPFSFKDVQEKVKSVIKQLN